MTVKPNTDLTKALGRVINDPDLTADQLDMLLPIVKAARRVADGRPRKARELVDSDGNEYWAVTIMVDGPGEYTLLDPPEET